MWDPNQEPTYAKLFVLDIMFIPTFIYKIYIDEILNSLPFFRISP